jgi:hypothetical protein
MKEIIMPYKSEPKHTHPRTFLNTISLLPAADLSYYACLCAVFCFCYCFFCAVGLFLLLSVTVSFLLLLLLLLLLLPLQPVVPYVAASRS